MGHTAGAIAGGDLSHRVEATDPRTEVGRARPRAQRDARPPRGGVRRAPGERGPAAPLPRRRLARAAHAAGLDPRLRRAVPHRRRARARGRREGDAADRGRGGAHGRAGRGPADARPPGRGAPTRRTPTSTSPRSRATPSTTRARPRPTARSTCSADGPALVVVGDPDQLRQVLANLLRNALVHTPRGHADRGDASSARATTCALEVRDHGPGLPTERRRRAVRALLARRGRARARQAAAPGLGLAIVAAIVDAHGGGVRAGNAAGRRRAASVVLAAASPPQERLPGGSQPPPIVVRRRAPTLWP